MAAVLPPPVLSPAALLEGRFPGAFTTNEHNGTYQCNLCFGKSAPGGLTHPALLHNAEMHNNSQAHADAAEQRRSGQHSLSHFGVRKNTGLAPASALLQSVPDRELLCRGYWLPAVDYGNGPVDARSLLGDERRGRTWWQSRWKQVKVTGGEPLVGSKVTHGNKRYIVTATNRFFGNVSLLPASLLNTNPPPLVVPAKQCTDVETTAEGTYYSDDCAEHCVGATQHPRRNLVCWPCERLVHEDDFNHRVTDRAAILAGGGFHPNTRSDNLPYDALLERTRGLASKCEAGRLMRMRALSKLGDSRVRAQKAEDRLRELSDAGNLSAVVRDLHACYDSSAFEDNEAALNFIKDIVSYAKNRNVDDSGGTSTRYSESTKRIFGLIDKLGGDACRRSGTRREEEEGKKSGVATGE